jgi:hypothetical protein
MIRVNPVSYIRMTELLGLKAQHIIGDHYYFNG